jgi:uncharacterized protein YdhG (YjbR/CyaY superfamily)
VADQISSVDDYIAGCPAEVQDILVRIRRTIAEAVPGSGETISYRLPTVTVNGRSLMYFAAWKKHIGIYPIPVLPEDLERRIAPYRSGQDSVKFPLREPIPYPLIGQVVTVLRQRRAEDDRDRGAA